MKNVLEFTHYRFRNGTGCPDNPHEVIRGHHMLQSQDFKQFYAFSIDETYPAPGIPDGKCKREFIELVETKPKHYRFLTLNPKQDEK